MSATTQSSGQGRQREGGMNWLRRYGIELALVAMLALAVLYFGYLALGLLPGNERQRDFAGSGALADVGAQLAFGARGVGTDSSLRMSEWLVQQLTGLGWDVVIQEFALSDALKGRNLVAIRSPEQGLGDAAPVGMIVAHYDSRLAADRDANPDNQMRSAPGANDGAAGAATLLELARVLDLNTAGQTICLAFTDADANVGLPGWNAAAGSLHLTQTLARDVPRCANPAWIVTLGLVGASNATFAPDAQGNATLQRAIWQQAARLGYANAFPTTQSVNLGANPFAITGATTATISDPTYPHAGTVADLSDKLSADALERIGRTLQEWIEAGSPR